MPRAFNFNESKTSRPRGGFTYLCVSHTSFQLSETELHGVVRQLNVLLGHRAVCPSCNSAAIPHPGEGLRADGPVHGVFSAPGQHSRRTMLAGSPCILPCLRQWQTVAPAPRAALVQSGCNKARQTAALSVLPSTTPSTCFLPVESRCPARALGWHGRQVVAPALLSADFTTYLRLVVY